MRLSSQLKIVGLIELLSRQLPNLLSAHQKAKLIFGYLVFPMMLYTGIPNLMVDSDIVDASTQLILSYMSMTDYPFYSSWVISTSNVHAGSRANPM